MERNRKRFYSKKFPPTLHPLQSVLGPASAPARSFAQLPDKCPHQSLWPWCCSTRLFPWGSWIGFEMPLDLEQPRGKPFISILSLLSPARLQGKARPREEREIPSLPLPASVLELMAALPGPAQHNLRALSPTSSKEGPSQTALYKQNHPDPAEVARWESTAHSHSATESG